MKYKFLNKFQKKNLISIENSFSRLIKKSNQNSLNIWYHNLSRLDFVPLAGLNYKNFYKINSSLSIFYKSLMFDLLKIIKFLIFSFHRNKKVIKKNILIYEKIFLNNDKMKNFYFDGLFNSSIFSEIVISLDSNNQKKKNQIPIYNLVTPFDVIVSLIISIRSLLNIYLLIKKTFRNNKKNKKFWIEFFYMKERIFNIFISNIIFKALNKKLYANKLIIFPYEEKTYERAIAKVGNKLKNDNIYGYILNPRHHLASYDKAWKKLNIPRVSRYLFCGEYYNKIFKNLKRSNRVPSKLNVIGSKKSKLKHSKIINDRKFLFLLSHENELINFFKMIYSNHELLKYKFTIRDYPNNPLTNIDTLINNYKLNNIVSLSKRNNSLFEDCKNMRGVIFSATSAGIEAINYGKIGIWVDLSEIGMNPIFDNIKNYFPSNTSEDLARNLNNIQNFNLNKYKKILNSQRRINKKFYSRIRKDNIKTILN